MNVNRRRDCFTSESDVQDHCQGKALACPTRTTDPIKGLASITGREPDEPNLPEIIKNRIDSHAWMMS